MRIDQLQPGQRVYNVIRRRMGNTTLRDTAVFSIVVKEIDPAGRWVLASWNSNPPEKFHATQVSKWKKDKPVTVAIGFGASRLATREELKLIKAQKEIDAVQPEGDNCGTHFTRYRTLKVDGGLTIKYCNVCRQEQGFKEI